MYQRVISIYQNPKWFFLIISEDSIFQSLHIIKRWLKIFKEEDDNFAKFDQSDLIQRSEEM